MSRLQTLHCVRTILLTTRECRIFEAFKELRGKRLSFDKLPLDVHQHEQRVEEVVLGRRQAQEPLQLVP